MKTESYWQKFRNKRKQIASNLLGNKCSICNSTKDLQFDHVNPKTKKGAIGKMWHAQLKVFMKELKKCQLLCRKCHIIKTNRDMGRPDRPVHGTTTMYRMGCRCKSCQQVVMKYQRKLRASKIESVA